MLYRYEDKRTESHGPSTTRETSPYTVTFPLDSQVSEQDQMVSLDNLNRLGLIQFKDLQLSGPSKYKFAKSTSLYKDSQRKEFDTLAKMEPTQTISTFIENVLGLRQQEYDSVIHASQMLILSKSNHLFTN